MPTDIILENENLIYKMSQKFYGVEREDLIQAGFLGLAKAYKNFDPKKSPAKFSTYAYSFIYGEMYEAATGNRSIRLRKNELKIYKSVMRTKELLESTRGMEVSYHEVCGYLHIDYNMFLSILNSLNNSISLEASEIDVPKRENIDDLILLKESLEALSPVERDVIVSRYMRDQSQDETAKVLGMSQVKVSRIEKSSREKIKNFISI